MSPINIFRRPSPTSDNQQPQKRAKLFTTSNPSPTSKLSASSTPTNTLNSPKEPLRSHVQAALNLHHANSLTSSHFTTQYIIPPSHRTFTTNDGALYTCTFQRTQDLTPEEKETCFQITKETSRRDYEANAEDGWDDERKRAEMGEEGMRFVLVRKAGSERNSEGKEQREDIHPTSISTQSEDPKRDDTILGFTSFTLEIDPDTHIPQLYIYEIHLLPSVRSLGLGKHLISLNETMARKLGLEKVMLTVFTCNARAERLYRRLGYGVDEQSPEERILRSGKVVRPKYLILSKELLDH